MTDASVPAGADAPDKLTSPKLASSRLRRLTKRAEFLHVAQGLSAARGAVVVQARAQTPASPHIAVGFTATRKIGGAVVRNRAKRRLRHAAAALLPVLGRPGTDYVLVARAGTPSRPWERLLDDVRQALAALDEGGDKSRPPPRRPRAPPNRSHG